MKKLEGAVPEKIKKNLGTVIEKILETMAFTAPKTLVRRNTPHILDTLDTDEAHQVMTIIEGVVSGFFGGNPPAVIADITSTMFLIFRSMGAIAHEYGYDPTDPATITDMLGIFSMGGAVYIDDVSDGSAATNYLELRVTLGKVVKSVATYAAEYSVYDASVRIAEEAVKQAVNTQGRKVAEAALERAIRNIPAAKAPVLVQQVQWIAAKLGAEISDKLAIKIVPVLGAATNGILNHTFMVHFQKRAHGHFRIRTLEERHGAESIRALLLNIDKLAKAAKTPLLQNPEVQNT